jgi:uncharacterized protein
MLTTPPLYTQSVPVLLRYLATLHRVLRAVQQLPASQAHAVLEARLAPGMLCFAQQIETACFLALRATFPLVHKALPAWQAEPRTHAGLCACVARTEVLLADLPPQLFASPPPLIDEKAGKAHIQLPPQEFLTQFALPNFFFHISMAYAIARSHNAPIGKAQFDGFHLYDGDGVLPAKARK